MRSRQCCGARGRARLQIEIHAGPICLSTSPGPLLCALGLSQRATLTLTLTLTLTPNPKSELLAPAESQIQRLSRYG